MADQADGRIIIDTAIDSKGFTADSAKLQRAVKSLSGKMEALGPTFQKAITGNSSAISSFEARSQSLKKTISELETELKALGERKYESAEYSELLSDLDKVDAKLAQIDAQKAKLSALGDGEDTKRWKNLEYEADILLEKQKRLNAEKARFEASGTNIYSGAETERYSQLSEALENARSRLSEMTSKEQEAANAGSRFGSVLSAIASGAKKAVSALGRTAINAVKRFCSRIKQTNTASNSLVKSLTSLKTMLISRIKRMFISEIFSSAKDGINALARFSTEFDRTMSNIKNRSKETSANLSVSLGNIISTVEPFITRIAAAFSTAITYVNALFAALSGKSTVIVAKKQTESYAESLEDTANAAKDAKRQLAGFDELNILSNGSSSGSSVSELFEEVPIDSALPDDVKPFFDRIYEAITSNDWYGAGDITAEGLNSIVNRVDDWFNNTLRPKGKMWAKKIAQYLNGLTDGFKWSDLGKTIGDGFNTVFDTAYTFLTTYNFLHLGQGIATSINSWLRRTDFSLIGKTLGALLRAQIEAAFGFLTTFDFELAGEKVADAINGFIDEMGKVNPETGLTGWQTLGQDLALTANGIIKMLTAALSKIDWKDVKYGLSDAISSFWKTANSKTKLALTIGLGVLTINSISKVLFGAGVLPLLVKSVGSKIAAAFSGTAAVGGTAAAGAAVGTSIFAWISAGLAGAVAGGVAGELADKYIIAPILEALGADSSYVEAYKNFSWLGTGPGSLYDTVTGWIGMGEQRSQAATNLATSNLKLIEALCDSGNISLASAKSYYKQVQEIVSSNMSSKKQMEALSDLNDKLLEVAETATQANNDMVASTSETQLTLKEKYDLMIVDLGDKADEMIVEIERPTKAATQAVEECADSISDSFSDMASSTAQTFTSLKTSAPIWGTDICSNLANGIKNGISKVGGAVKSVADKIKSLIGFSEPEDGPLSDFHTYMPDMIDLMTQGIKQNQGKAIGAVADMASAISDEVSGGNYSFGKIGVSAGIDTVLNNFSDKIVNGFDSLIDRLSAIAKGVNFTVPAVATGGIVPYSVSAAANGGNGAARAIEASNDELSSVVIQSVTNATAAIVRAIQDYSGTTVNMDIDSITTGVIAEINRKTRMTGKSPLQI